MMLKSTIESGFGSNNIENLVDESLLLIQECEQLFKKKSEGATRSFKVYQMQVDNKLEALNVLQEREMSIIT